MQTEMLAPVTKSSAPCLVKYTKVIDVNNIEDVKKKLNVTVDTTLPDSRYLVRASS